ncbi:MAG: hypothetical protein K2X86_13890, partial [Cytophagaceae bacterium]|nr:hypothetical protein [Cytophagaceae bacterium]
MIFLKNDIVAVLLISLVFVIFHGNASGQTSGDSVFIQVPSPIKKDSIVMKGKLISFKDTVINQCGDTVVFRKEVWIKENDSLYFIVDSIPSVGYWVLMAEDSVVTVRDTVVIIQDTIFTRNEKLLQNIKEFSEKDNFFSRILSAIVVFDDPPPSVNTKPVTQQSDKLYERYEGKVIRNIDIRVLDVFGYSLTRPEKKPKGFIEKSGNVIHIKSHRWLIRNKLLFKEGETVNSLKLSESERLIRENNYIYNARITVKDSVGKDTVDVIVTVQDVW